MGDKYTIQQGAKELLQTLISDDRLLIEPAVKELTKTIKFTGWEEPFVPCPAKFTESASAFGGLVAAAAIAVAKDRYGVEQEATVDTDRATVALSAAFQSHVDGVMLLRASKGFLETAMEADKYDLMAPLHFVASNHYKTKDGRYYQCHASMNAAPMMKMLGIEERPVGTKQDAYKIWQEKIQDWNSKDIDETANEEYKQAGTVIYSPEEFFETEHGKIAGKEAVAGVYPVPAKAKPWPTVKDENLRPLEGIRVIDMSRAVAAPVVGKMLAALGADVLHISCRNLPDPPLTMPEVHAGKRDIFVDLKTEAGKKHLRDLIVDADVIIDGYRPNAIAKLGFGQEQVRKINPQIVFVRENCYGYHGPWAHRSGWQQVADCVSGLSMLQGRWLGWGEEPVQPLFPNADYQTGFLGGAIVTNALLRRAHNDETYNIDLSLVHYDIFMMRHGMYTDEQQKALRKLHPDFNTHYYNDIGDCTVAAVESIEKFRPGLYRQPQFFIGLDGKHWNEERPINIVRPPFDFSKSANDFRVPSGKRGWSDDNPTWIPIGAQA